MLEERDPRVLHIIMAGGVGVVGGYSLYLVKGANPRGSSKYRCSLFATNWSIIFVISSLVGCAIVAGGFTCGLSIFFWWPSTSSSMRRGHTAPSLQRRVVRANNVELFSLLCLVFLEWSATASSYPIHAETNECVSRSTQIFLVEREEEEKVVSAVWEKKTNTIWQNTINNNKQQQQQP